MIAIDCEQGSPEWFEARLGVPTASQFGRILTAKTRKLGAGAETYMNELLAEWLVGEPIGGDLAQQSGHVERGSIAEDSAVLYYQMQRDVETQRVGFALDDERRYGASPDRLVNDDGGLEIKVPSAKVQIATWRGDTSAHFAQAQGGLLVTGREWWDVLSFHELIPATLVRYERDESYLRTLEDALGAFSARLEREKQRLLDAGAILRRPLTERKEKAAVEPLPF